jgi:hypothetical protein
MAVCMFEVGEICVYKGYICRVSQVERVFAKGMMYMNIPDGYEFNPTLTMIPLYAPDGKPVKKTTPRSAPSGAVHRADYEIQQLEATIEVSKKKVELLKGLTKGEAS